MLFTLIQKEMMHHVLSARFVALLLMCVLLIPSPFPRTTESINATSSITKNLSNVPAPRQTKTHPMHKIPTPRW